MISGSTSGMPSRTATWGRRGSSAASASSRRRWARRTRSRATWRTKAISSAHHEEDPMAKPFHPEHKVKGGYKLIAKSTGKPLEKHPISKARVDAQLRAVEFHKHNPGA